MMPSLPTNLDRRPAGMDAPDFASLMRSADFASTASTANLLACDANQPFFLRHHPKAWRISTTLPTTLILPDVTKHVIAPGVNGIRTRRKNEPPEAQYRMAIMDQQSKRWVYLDPAAPIPAGCLPDGVPPGSYIREMACQGLINRSIGKHYAEAWEIPIETLPDDPQRFQFDTAKYERWLKFLVESGQINPPLRGILAAMKKRASDHVDRIETLNLQPNVAKKWLKFRGDILANYEAATVADRLSHEDLSEIMAGYLTAGDEPKKKKKRGDK